VLKKKTKGVHILLPEKKPLLVPEKKKEKEKEKKKKHFLG
jgi:hypothetical protein